MKEYIPTGTSGKYIEYDPATNVSKVIVKSEVETQIANWEAELASLPEITDEILLAWAKDNYPDYGRATFIEALIAEAEAAVQAME